MCRKTRWPGWAHRSRRMAVRPTPTPLRRRPPSPAAAPVPLHRFGLRRPAACPGRRLLGGVPDDDPGRARRRDAEMDGSRAPGRHGPAEAVAGMLGEVPAADCEDEGAAEPVPVRGSPRKNRAGPHTRSSTSTAPMSAPQREPRRRSGRSTPRRQLGVEDGPRADGCTRDVRVVRRDDRRRLDAEHPGEHPQVAAGVEVAATRREVADLDRLDDVRPDPGAVGQVVDRHAEPLAGSRSWAPISRLARSRRGGDRVPVGRRPTHLGRADGEAPRPGCRLEAGSSARLTKRQVPALAGGPAAWPGRSGRWWRR